jgi:hypothetical protein
MVEYKCMRCGYIAKQKIHLRNHLNRKNICKPILEDISIESIKELYGFETSSKYPQKSSKIPQVPQLISTKTPQNILKNPQNILKNPQNSGLFFKNLSSKNLICIYCNKLYSRSDNLNRHYFTCKEKNKSEELVLLENNKITEMENKIKELEEKNIKIVKKLKKQKHTNITNSNNTNTTNTNITNNIIIKNFGEENIEHLQDNIYENLLQGIYTAVPKLIKLIHFDKNHPENQNIKFTNKKYPYLKIMKDDKWQLVNKNLEVRDLIDNKCYILNEKYYNILEKQNELNDVQRSRIRQFMKKYKDDHKGVILDLINKTELILLNNS